jgi:pantothenate kinase
VISSVILRDSDLRKRLICVERGRAEALSQNSDKSIVDMSDAVSVALQALDTSGHARIVVGLAGFPASGKTTMAKQIVLAIDDRIGFGRGVHLPMDGFHLRNVLLKSQGTDSIKGDISTYDVDALVNKLVELQRNPSDTVYAPDYVRTEHEVREDAIEVARDVRIVCLEGIYVGYGEGRWSKARGLIDVLFYLDVPPDVCADRIVSRNLAAGRSDTCIRRKLANDFGFMTRTMTIIEDADYIVRELVS